MKARLLFLVLALGCNGPVPPDETSADDNSDKHHGVEYEIKCTIDAKAVAKLEGYKKDETALVILQEDEYSGSRYGGRNEYNPETKTIKPIPDESRGKRQRLGKWAVKDLLNSNIQQSEGKYMDFVDDWTTGPGSWRIHIETLVQNIHDPFCAGGLVVCTVKAEESPSSIFETGNPIKNPLCIPPCWEKNAASYVKKKLKGGIEAPEFSLDLVGKVNPYLLILSFLERRGGFSDIRLMLQKARDAKQRMLVAVLAYLVLLDALERKDLMPIVTVSVEVTESKDFDYISDIAVGFIAFKGNKDWRLLDHGKVKELHDTIHRQLFETRVESSPRRDGLHSLLRRP